MDERLVSIIKQILLFLALVYKVLLAYIEAVGDLVQPRKRKSVKGKNVLITGSGHGLGRELALKFAQLGANLILVDINQENNERVCQEINRKCKSANSKVYAFSVDIRNEQAVRELAEKTRRVLGHVDLLINNAGIVQCLPFLSLSPALMDRTFQVNVLAHMWTVRHFLPSMIEHKSGHIVAISSIAGLIGNKYLTDYCASKFAVVGLMESLDREIHDKGANKDIHLTTICPTCMSTGMFKTFTSKFDWLLPVLSADQVAESTIEAILTNRTFAAIPPVTLFFHRLSYLLPTKVSQLVQDYLDYGVQPHRAS